MFCSDGAPLQRNPFSYSNGVLWRSSPTRDEDQCLEVEGERERGGKEERRLWERQGEREVAGYDLELKREDGEGEAGLDLYREAENEEGNRKKRKKIQIGKIRKLRLE